MFTGVASKHKAIRRFNNMKAFGFHIIHIMDIVGPKNFNFQIFNCFGIYVDVF